MRRHIRRISIWLALVAVELIALNLPHNDRLSRLLDRLVVASEGQQR